MPINTAYYTGKTAIQTRSSRLLPVPPTTSLIGYTVAKGTGDGATSVTVSIPGGTVQGDLLLLGISTRNAVVATPSLFSSVYAVDVSSSEMDYLFVCYDAPNAVTITVPPFTASGYYTIILAAFKNAKGTISQTRHQTSPVEIPALTIGVPKRYLLIGIAHGSYDADYATSITGLTTVGSYQNGSSGSILMAYKTVKDAGTYGPYTVNLTGAMSYSGYTATLLEC